MTKIYTNNSFVGKVNGVSINDLYVKSKQIRRDTLDELIKAYNEELFKVEVINGREFYNEDLLVNAFIQDSDDGEKIYPGKVKLILNKDDSLYSDSNVCKFLESLGSELLNKYDGKDKGSKIKVYHSKSLFEKAMDEQNELRRIAERSVDARYAIENDLDDSFVLTKQSKYLIQNKRNITTDDEIILANQINYKLEKRIDKLKDNELKDLNDLYKDKYPVVNTYYLTFKYYKELYNILSKYPESEWGEHKFKKIRRFGESRKKRRILRNIYSLREDFIDSINAKARFIMFKAPLPDQGCPSWDEYDEKEASHVRYALQLSRNEDLQNDMACIVYDLDYTISLCEFTDIQSQVLKLYRKDKTQEQIGNMLNITRPTVNKHIDLIVNKIVNKNWELYEGWYYMNICKGVYKKCSRCKEIKLLSQFNKKKSSKDGYDTKCKLCFNMNRKR